MTGIFDGMAGVLNGLFGAPVTITPDGGEPAVLRGVFREEPVEVADGDNGSVIDVAITLRVQRPGADDVETGAIVAPGNGKTYRIMNRITSGSPAADGFTVFELKETS